MRFLIVGLISFWVGFGIATSDDEATQIIIGGIVGVTTIVVLAIITIIGIEQLW